MNIRSYFNGIINRWEVFAPSLLLGLIFGIVRGEAAQLANALAPPPRQQPAPSQPPVTLPIVKSIYFIGPRQTVNRQIPVTVTGGQEIRGRIELSGPAPCVWNCGKQTLTGQRSGGLPVQLSVNNPALANVPSVVVVPTDQTYQEFAFLTAPVTAPAQVTAVAAVQNSPPQSTASFTILPPVLTQFVLDQSNVLGGTLVKGALHFTGPPASPSAVKVQISTTHTAAVQIPATVALEPNKTVALFDISTLGVDQDRNVHIVATLQDRILPAPLTIRAAALKGIASLGFHCGNPGRTGVRVRLTGGAGPGGATVSVSSSNPALLAVPPNFTVPAQQSAGDITMPVTQFLSAVTVTVSYQGKSDKTTINATAKPDLFVKSVSFFDSYGNAITQAQNSQPFKMRVTVSIGEDTCLRPPPTTLYVSYSSPTGSGTSTGRSFEVPVGSLGGPIDIDLPGLQPGSYHDITLITDYRKQVDERNEGNNTKNVKINGPAAP
jgi:hypothetical protein